MSKSSHGRKKLSDAQLAEHLRLSLINIEKLIDIYDGGHPYIAYTIASDLVRLLTENSYLVRHRGSLNFSSPNTPVNRNNLTASSVLIIMSIDNRTPHVDFMPVFQTSKPPVRFLKFSEWWNSDVIHVNSFAKPTVPAGIIPLDPKEQLPWEQRRKLTRREFVQIIRNKLGSHLDDMQPDFLHELQKAESFGLEAQVDRGDGKIYSTFDGTLPVNIGPTAAMIRQIAEEVLLAYGQRLGGATP